MYGAIWRILPGPTAVKVVEALILIAAVVVALFMWVFPWVEKQLRIGEVTVTSSATMPPASLSYPQGFPQLGRTTAM